MRRWLALLLLLLGAAAPGPTRAADGDDVTAWVAPLRAQAASLRALAGELRVFVNSGTTDRAKIHALGTRAMGELDAVRRLVAGYRGATTRVGLSEEAALLDECADLVGFVGQAYGRLTGVAPEPPTAEELQRERGRARAFVAQVVPELVAHRLGGEGLSELLTTRSFGEAAALVSARVVDGVLGELDAELTRLIDVGVSAGRLQISVRRALDRLLTHHVGRLVARVTPQALVVELASRAIVRWVGPKLREALRHKGHLEERVFASASVIGAAEQRLQALRPDGPVSLARLALEDAERALRSTEHLLGDLVNAGRHDLIGTYSGFIMRLRRVMEWTRHRFLIGAEASLAQLDGMLAAIDFVRGELARMQAGMRPGPREPYVPPEQPPGPPRDQVAGTYEANDPTWADHEAMRESTRANLTVSGSAREAELTFRGVRADGHHYRARVVWDGRSPSPDGVERYLDGTAEPLGGAGHPHGVRLRVTRGRDGVWRATLLQIAGNSYALTPTRTERIR